MDNTEQSPLTSISIGPGIRGIERGVGRVVRLDHLAYVEIEAFIIENLVAQMELGLLAPAVIWSDAKTCNWEIFRGLVDILFSGYPCQPFSTAGRRKGAEDPRHLYPYIEGAIRIIRPRICFFENVRGHVTCGLPEVIESLEGLGYRVRWGIYSAEETGASHKRERVFILAVANSKLQSIYTRIRGLWRKSDSTGSKLANTASFRCGSLGAESTGFQRGAITDNAGDELANTNFRGQQQWQSSGMGRVRQSVARPGQQQHGWEHPRIITREIESTVGLSAHGYHFREDVLRALGNSVYEDTAELTFRDLLNKHGIEL